MRINVFDDIEKERRAQDAKWGGPEHDDKHEPADWLHYIHEHRGRADLAALKGDGVTYRKQLIRVAALAIAATEAFDREASR